MVKNGSIVIHEAVIARKIFTLRDEKVILDLLFE